MFYAVVLAAVGLVMLAALIRREPVDLNVLRDRNPVFVRLSNGDIRNAYTLKIMNRGDRTVTSPSPPPAFPPPPSPSPATPARRPRRHDCAG